MKEQMLAILNAIRPDLNFEEETELVDDAVLDSLDIIQIVQEFNDTFKIDITIDDLVPENFNDLAGMMALVEALMK